jgi:prepilin-type N-terminal cleavage/methylation domain-containing protein
MRARHASRRVACFTSLLRALQGFPPLFSFLQECHSVRRQRLRQQADFEGVAVTTSNRAFGQGVKFHLVRGSARKGFTLLEVTLAMSVLVVAMMAISATTLRVHTLRRQNHERSVAENAVRMIAERIQSASRLARTNPAGWAPTMIADLNPGGSVGNTFDLFELTPTNAGSSVGSITVVTNENTTDAALDAQLGMPRDLDGDGLVANPNVAATARLLPVIVRARWKGVSGDQEIVHPFYVLGY